MDEFERYLFDLQGFLLVESVLTEVEVKTLNHILDQQIAALDHPNQSCLRFDGLLSWGQAYRSLIDHPQITPYLTELLGDNFRLDHEYTHIIRHGKGPIGCHLHGGGTPHDPGQYYLYKGDRMYNGLIAVAYNLTEVLPGEGGFGCIPGSHKSNLPLPASWRNLDHPPGCVREVAAKAGSALIFTEALTHGTLPWQGTGERRTLFYKYSPFPSAWSRRYPNSEDYPDLTEAQRRRLKSPGVYP
jgi:hypothetical protein